MVSTHVLLFLFPTLPSFIILLTFSFSYAALVLVHNLVLVLVVLVVLLSIRNPFFFKPKKKAVESFAVSSCQTA